MSTKIPAEAWRDIVDAVAETFDVCGPGHETWRELRDIDVDTAVELRDKLQALIEAWGESRRMVRPKPSTTTIAARTPLAPELLVDTLEDGVPRGRGRILGTTPVKVTRK